MLLSLLRSGERAPAAPAVSGRKPGWRAPGFVAVSLSRPWGQVGREAGRKAQ